MEGRYSDKHRQKIERFIAASSKSTTLALVYATVYGPFGCFYTDPRGAVVAIFLAVALGIVYLPLIALVWIGCILMAPLQVRAYNAQVRRRARYLVV